MALPPDDVDEVQRYCREKVPERLWHELKVECDVAPRHLTIVETRPPWREDFGPEWTRFPVARLAYTMSTGLWTLRWRDRNLRFHTYDLLRPQPRVGRLLAEVERDPTAIFWG